MARLAFILFHFWLKMTPSCYSLPPSLQDGVLLLAEKFNNVYSSTERDVIELSSAISAVSVYKCIF